MLRCLGNLLWLLFGGIIISAGWFVTGLIWCVTIVGIPVGVQCFKFAALSFWPFGSEVRYGGGTGSMLLNVLWLVFGGLILAGASIVTGLALFLTGIGVPLGFQCFKLARLALMPFGAEIIKM